MDYPRGGQVLKLLLPLIDARRRWSVQEIVHEYSLKAPIPSKRALHNAILYLCRRGHIKHLSYGMYETVSAQSVDELTRLAAELADEKEKHKITADFLKTATEQRATARREAAHEALERAAERLNQISGNMATLFDAQTAIRSIKGEYK